MGAAMRLGRMRNGDERSPIDSGCGRRGLRRPKPGCCYAVETSFFAIVVRSARHSACLRTACSRCRLWAPHSAVLKHGPRSRHVCESGGRVNRKAQGRRLAGSLSGLPPARPRPFEKGSSVSILSGPKDGELC
ncbi:hypothetical protein Syun_031941 [Stephania yunnanensis]|uniref:Uncharacterized protein n=1 Tax=Stephania yunnanensis TaxID=152371 RepID=A0AAP0DTL7_9MAGN